MGKILTIPRFWGPLATVVFTVIYHAGVIQGWYEVSLIGVTVFVAVGAFMSGLRGGLLAAAWGSAYALYVMLPFTRLIWVIAGMVAIAVLLGWQTRGLRRALAETQAALALAQRNQEAADFIDSANGNINKLRVALKMLDDLLAGWDYLADDARRNLIIQIRTHLATLILLVSGWHKLAQEKRYAEGDDVQHS